jgi:hypothetical protein
MDVTWLRGVLEVGQLAKAVSEGRWICESVKRQKII